MNVVHKIYNLLRRLEIALLPNYIRKENGEKWIFVSYLTDPFKKKNDPDFFKGHQNQQETLILDEILHELDLSYFFHHYARPLNFVNQEFDVVFGLEPNFGYLCNNSPKALKIYYATGAYYQHQNSMIRQRTDDFNKKYGVAYPYERLVPDHDSCEIADAIVQIGSAHTISTYPEALRKKITLLDQTCHEFDAVDLEKKIAGNSKRDFIWFGSRGSILKGLDLVLEYFLIHPDLNLHVVGPVEQSFVDIFGDKISECKNITFYGYLSVDSQTFRDLADRCAFLIYPSASEGGCPGSVLNLRRLGVIPILSLWASGEDISTHGYLLEDLSLDSIERAVTWGTQLSEEKLAELVHKNHQYVNEHHNKKRFKKQLESALRSLLEKREQVSHE